MRKKSLICVFIFAIFILSLGVRFSAAENLNLKITGTVNNYSSDFFVKTNPNANNGIDTYDMVAPSDPGTDVPVFYSIVDGSNLVIDTANLTNRTVNAIISLPVAQSGNLTFSWTALTGDYDGTLTYYSDDDSYTTAVGSVNMRTSSTYSATISAKSNLYVKIVTSSYSAPVTPDDNTQGTSGGSTGSGDSTTTGFWKKTIDSTKNNINNPTNYTLSVRQKVQFIAGKSVHSVGIVSVAQDQKSAVLQIMSTPQNVTFFVGDLKKFDLEDTGLEDLSIKLNSITSQVVDISINYLNPEVNQTITGGAKEEEPVSTNSSNDNTNSTKRPIDKNSVIFSFIINIIIFIIGAIIIIFIVIKIFKMRNKNADAKAAVANANADITIVGKSEKGRLR